MNINKKKLGIIGAISIISVILISVFIFTQIGPYDKNNKKDIVVEIPQGATTSTISDILYKNKSYTSRHVFLSCPLYRIHFRNLVIFILKFHKYFT